jgi:hypothetical protein
MSRTGRLGGAILLFVIAMTVVTELASELAQLGERRLCKREVTGSIAYVPREKPRKPGLFVCRAEATERQLRLRVTLVARRPRVPSQPHRRPHAIPHEFSRPGWRPAQACPPGPSRISPLWWLEGNATLIAFIIPVAVMVSGAQTSPADPLLFAGAFLAMFCTRLWAAKRLMRHEIHWPTAYALRIFRVRWDSPVVTTRGTC